MDIVERYREKRKERLDRKAVDDFRERRDNRLKSRLDDEEEGGHGNTRIPFGLCQREGIQIDPDWTPSDAWAALEKKGVRAGDIYKQLREKGNISGGRVLSARVKRLLRPKKDEAIFFSGCAAKDSNDGRHRSSVEVAKEYAGSNAGKTLGMMIEENGVDIPEWDFNEPGSVSKWEAVSSAYAEQASGDVRVIAKPPLRKGNIFEAVELPKLKENENVTSVTMINPETGEKKVIFRR